MAGWPAGWDATGGRLSPAGRRQPQVVGSAGLHTVASTVATTARLALRSFVEPLADDDGDAGPRRAD